MPPLMHKSLVRALAKLLPAPGSYSKRHHLRADFDSADSQRDSRLSASEIFRGSVAESPRGSLAEFSMESSHGAERESLSEVSRTSTRRDSLMKMTNQPGNQHGDQPMNQSGFLSWAASAADERVLGAAVLRECGKVVGVLCEKALAAVEEEKQRERERELEAEREAEAERAAMAEAAKE
eukprot:3269501-Pleurochrysis_carterae.AAC.1